MPKIALNPGTLLAPVPPVLVTCGTLEKPNIITIAWTGILNTKPPMTYISVRPSRFSHSIISETREFVINLATERLVFATDFCGVKSGADVDKFLEMKLDAVPSSKVKAPSIAQSPVSLECRVIDITPLGSHDMFTAEIVGILADDEFIDKNGKLDLANSKLITYSHGEYFALGKRLGSFGYSVRKKKKHYGKPKNKNEFRHKSPKQ